jgi:large subunit ribosomal protein L30
MLRIELTGSLIGNNPRNRRTVQALGLRKMHQVVEHKDSASVRGMIHKVKHMVTVVEVPDVPEVPEAPVKPAKAAKPAKKAEKTEESPSEPE